MLSTDTEYPESHLDDQVKSQSFPNTGTIELRTEWSGWKLDVGVEFFCSIHCLHAPLLLVLDPDMTSNTIIKYTAQ